jgi:lipid-A-disaccharide synthase
MARVYVSAGEPSGDLHASRLVSALLAREPSLEIFGMGGPRMREAGCEIVQPIDQLALMGFAEVFWGLPRIWRAFGRLIGLIRERRPDVAVLVDYPGFHLRLARRLKKEGVPVVVYIAPQVWAWKPGRARAVAGLARKVLVIFEF